MKRQNMLLTSVLCACVTLGSHCVVATAVAAPAAQVPAKPTNVSQALKLKYPEHQTQVASPKVGQKAVEAYDLYSAEKAKEAIAVLKDINSKEAYDKAYIDRFIGNILAAEEGKSKEAIKYLTAAVKPNVLNPSEQAQSIRLLGDLYAQEKDYKLAVSTYQQWLDYTGFEEKGLFLRMAQANYELQKYKEMIPLCDKAIALSEKPDKNPYLLKLTSFYERKMYKESVAVLEDVVRLFPDDPKWWTQLGMFYMLIEDYDKALATMEVAYRNDLLNKESHFKSLAQMYYSKDIPYKAAIVLEKHLDKGDIQRDDRMVSLLANSYRSAKHFDKAAKYYGEVAQMKNDGEMYRKQASMYLVMEEYDQAIKAAQNALKAGLKNEGNVNMMIAEAYLYQKNLKNAYKYAKIAAQDPSSKKMAESWAAYIKSKADQKKISIN